MSRRLREAMYDTVACFIEPPAPLSDALFQGGVVTERFGTSQAVVRLFLNPAKDDEYAPRVTYWRSLVREVDAYTMGTAEDMPQQCGENGLLKFEFSVAKLAGVTLENVTEADKERALDKADVFAERFGALPSVRLWRVQRVDFAWMWRVGSLLAVYMTVLARLQISSWSRHPYDAAEGVVWKSESTKGRWVKFYNKTKELGLATGVDDVLRFEVSNYKDAVRYMADSWYGCERIVGEMLQPGRALYCMSVQWDRLGLGNADSYGREEMEMLRLRDVFDKRWMQASKILELIRAYGSQVYQAPLNLMSRDMYFRYKRELDEEGFLPAFESQDRRAALPALHLPVDEIEDFDVLAESWKTVAGEGKSEQKNFWENSVKPALGLSGGRPSNYILGRIADAIT